MKKPQVKGLYYITHVDNIPSILKQGILSHALVERQKIKFTPIYDVQIVTNRQKRQVPSGKSLWDFANVYFQPRNPMLYRVIQRQKNDVAILRISPKILNISGAYISTGNAASGPSEILPAKDGLDSIFQIWNIINNEWWKEEDGSKRQIMAECLIPDMIPAEYIDTAYVANHTVADKVKQSIPSSAISVIPEPYMFFQPNQQHKVTDKLYLVEGDMFFSQMQTLTISVNTVGVMGKGLASRAKYQFPDVYVLYQDLCRQKTLKMGKPFIYKRESFLDNQLADDPSMLPNINSNKWFLLFPTKEHWRSSSDINGIEQGLEWIVDNYKKENLVSLAMPALGCGLGGLDWNDVGPLMCRYLSKLDIFVSIYLPREQEVKPLYLTPKFLLGKI